jgi:DNA-binding NarL/FixJ family response regulator
MEFKRYLDLARAKLTNNDFQAEQAAGRIMSLEQAVRYAQQLQLQPAPEQQAGAKGDGLTAREREVAVLVVQGKTNRAIAEHLVLSKRTVEKHIGNILSKLGLTSRSQIVRWAIEQGLTKASG